MNTTLHKIKSFRPCAPGWDKLLRGLGKTVEDDEPLPFVRILDINGIENAVWALRTCDDKSAVLTFACDCAEHVLHVFEAKYPDDNRPRKAIETTRAFILGEVSEVDLRTAARAAYAATYAAARAAYAAADAAADAADAAANVAYDAANVALRAADAAAYAAADAARAAARDAARDAANATARDTERTWQTNRYREIFG